MEDLPPGRGMEPAGDTVPVVVVPGGFTSLALVRLKLGTGGADVLIPHQSTAQPVP